MFIISIVYDWGFILAEQANVEIEATTILPFDDLTPKLEIKEQIGSQRRVVFKMASPWDSFIDSTRTDYKFWDKARRGKATGLELSGLFIKPLGSKVCAWVLGRPPQWQTNRARATRELNAWWQRWTPSIMRAYEEALDLGDCYLVFNGDSSLTIVPPNVVTPIVDENNFQTRIGWRIETSYAKDDTYQAMTIIDEYTAVRRKRTVKRDGKPDQITFYPNPLGVIPVVHVANIFGADELYGRPEGEPLLSAFVRYGDVFDAALKGNIRQGRPTPVIEKMGTASQVDEFWQRYGTQETRTNPDGSTDDVWVINFDPDMLLTLGGDAIFRYEAPGSFSVDTQNLLGLLFYLILQHTEIPEAFWGNAIGSSKASAEAQLEPFIQYIQKKRGLAMGWIQQLADIAVAYFGVINRQMRSDSPFAMWKPMTSAEARLMLDSTIWLFAKKMLDPEMATWLTPLNINDPKLIADRAREYWGDEYALGNPTSNTAPASGGGTQDQFNRQTNPIQPTERAMSGENVPLYEQDAENIIRANRQNGHRHEPVPA